MPRPRTLNVLSTVNSVLLMPVVRNGAPLEQPFNWKQRQDRHRCAAPETGVRLAIVGDRAAALTLLDPSQLRGLIETQTICAPGHFAVEYAGNRLCQLRRIQHEPHFGVEPRGARIEVERADEHSRSIDGERLGMQAGAGTPGESMPLDFGGRECALQFEQRYAS